jgi:hypothetical protein
MHCVPVQGILPTVQQIHKFQKMNTEPEQANAWKTTMMMVIGRCDLMSIAVNIVTILRPGFDSRQEQ